MEKGFCCFKCNKSFGSYKLLIKHISLTYPYLNKYQCKQNNCDRFFKDLNGLRKHYSATHNVSSSSYFYPSKQYQNLSLGTVSPLNASHDIASTSKDNKIPLTNESPGLDLHKTVIRFIAKLYSDPTLNRKNVQNIVEDITELFTGILENIFDKLISSQNPLEIFQKEVKSICEIFKNMRSEYLRMQSFETLDTFPLPKPFYIGEQMVLDNISTPNKPPGIKTKTDVGQKISIKFKLKKFLELPNVFNEISTFISNCNKDKNVLSSIIQGQLWKKIENIYGNKIVFPLLLFYDDFEPNNPLGSRAVIYKIGAVYISLACIPP